MNRGHKEGVTNAYKGIKQTCVLGVFFPRALVFWVFLTPIPERQSLQCRKHSFPHPSVHQTDRCYYYCYCSSRGWNIFKHCVFKHISFYNELYNFSQIHKFLQRKLLQKHCILRCFLKMGYNWTHLYAKTQVFTMIFFNLRANVSKNMFLTMF